MPWALTLALVATLAGCDGGGEGEGTPTDTGAGGTPGMGGSPADLGPPGDAGVLSCDTPQPARLGCPAPGTLPFETEASAFDDPGIEEALAAFPEYKQQNQDFLGNPDAAQSLVGRMARGRALNARPIPNEFVSLWTWNATGHFEQLGRQRTDGDGRYTFDLSGDDRFGLGTHITYAVLEGDGSCADHLVASWPAGTQVVVTDIDETLTTADAEFLRQIGDPSYDPQLRPGSIELMNAWAEKGYKAIYLTARPHDFRVPTRGWLAAHGYPTGPVGTATSLVVGDAAVAYKAAFIGQLVNDLGWSVVAAYGNADSDIQAYAQAGVPKSVTFVVGTLAGEDGTVAIEDGDYSNHVATYVAAQPAAVQPFAADEPFCR